MLFKCILTESTGNERENTSTWTDIRNFWPLMNEITKINSVLLLQSCAKHWPFLVSLKFVKPANVWKSTWARLFANFWRKFQFFKKFFKEIFVRFFFQIVRSEVAAMYFSKY